jgi:hypothetical protein
VQVHVHLIPIPGPDQPPTGPDPPENIYHYTTGLKLRSIINSGAIKPTTAKIEPHEKPVAWFSTQEQWEPTATKVPIAGLQGHHEVDVHRGIGIDSHRWQSSVNWLPTFEPRLLGNILKRQFDHIGLQCLEDRAGSLHGCPNDAVVLAAID